MSAGIIAKFNLSTRFAALNSNPFNALNAILHHLNRHGRARDGTKSAVIAARIAIEIDICLYGRIESHSAFADTFPCRFGIVRRRRCAKPFFGYVCAIFRRPIRFHVDIIAAIIL